MLYLQPKNNTEKHLIQVLLALMNDLPVEKYNNYTQNYEKFKSEEIYLKDIYRIKLNFLDLKMWAMIDKKFQYVVINPEGQVFFSVEKPTLDLEYNCWTSAGEVQRCDIIDASSFKDKWQFSLCDRKGNTYIEPQNQYQEFMVQVLLAKKHDITVLTKETYDSLLTFTRPTYKEDYDFFIINLFKEYKINEVTNKIEIYKLWNYINKQYNYIAKDKDGAVHLFKSKPHIFSDCWVEDEHKNLSQFLINDILTIDVSNVAWNESLSARLGY